MTCMICLAATAQSSRRVAGENRIFGSNYCSIDLYLAAVGSIQETVITVVQYRRIQDSTVITPVFHCTAIWAAGSSNRRNQN